MVVHAILLCVFICLLKHTTSNKFIVTTPSVWYKDESASISFVNLDSEDNDVYIAQLNIFEIKNSTISASNSEVEESNLQPANSTLKDQISELDVDNATLYHETNASVTNNKQPFTSSSSYIINSEIELHNVTVEITKKEQVHQVVLTSGFKVGLLRLRVIITKQSSLDFKFQQSCEVHLKEVESFKFIQFNKEVYQPSDKVKIRLLDLKGKNPRPNDCESIEKVYVENCDSVKVQEWIKPPSHHGLYEFILPLASEAKLGVWKVCVQSTLSNRCQVFNVDKYESPKFSLSVTTTPPHLDWTGDVCRNVSVDVVVCARNNDGTTLVGESHIRMYTETSIQASMQILRLNSTGCVKLEGVVKEVKNRVVVDVKVLEDNTGDAESSTSFVPILKRPTPELSPTCSKYFVPGTSYYCYGWVRKENGRAAKGVVVMVMSPAGAVLVEEVADESGFFQFTLPGEYTVNAPELRLFVRLKSPNLFEYRYVGFHTPTITIRKVFSATHTYLQINREEYVEKEKEIINKYYSNSDFSKCFSSSSFPPTSSSSFSSPPSSPYSPSPPLSNYLLLLSNLLHLPTNPLPLNISIFSPLNLTGNILDIKFLLLSRSQILMTGNISLSLSKATHNFNIQKPFECQNLNRNPPYDNHYYDDDENENYKDDDTDDASNDNDIKRVIDEEKCKQQNDNDMFVYNSLHLLHIPPFPKEPFKLLLFYHHSDEEIVIDELSFYSRMKADPYPVKMSFEEDFTNREKSLALRIEGMEDSWCGVKVVNGDYMGCEKRNDLSMQKIENDLSKYDGKGNGSNEDGDCNISEKDDEKAKGDGFSQNDAPIKFKTNHLSIITNINITLPSCINDRSIHSKFLWPMKDKPSPSPHHSFSRHRHLTSETWLFDLHYINATTTVTEVPLQTPNTSTNWLGSGFCVNPINGISFSPSFATKNLKQITIKMFLPKSILKGENVIGLIVVLNPNDFAINASLDVTSNGNARISLRSTPRSRYNVDDSDTTDNSNEGKYDNYDNGDDNGMIIVPKGSSIVKVSIRGATKETNFTANVEARKLNEGGDEDIEFRDSVQKRLRVLPTGSQVTLVNSLLICPEETLFVNITPNTHTIVRGSLKARMKISTETFFPLLSILSSFETLPTHHSSFLNIFQNPFNTNPLHPSSFRSQNMDIFYMNWLVLEYLRSHRMELEAWTEEKMTKLEKQAKDDLKIGYQEQLNYKQDDGSYSSMSPTDWPGAIGLTSFAVLSFVRASDYIYIDPDIIKNSTSFIKKTQHSNGCFPFNVEDLNTTTNYRLNTEQIPFNSEFSHNCHVIISLIQAEDDIKDVSIQNGLKCLAAMASTNDLQDKNFIFGDTETTHVNTDNITEQQNTDNITEQQNTEKYNNETSLKNTDTVLGYNVSSHENDTNNYNDSMINHVSNYQNDFLEGNDSIQRNKNLHEYAYVLSLVVKKGGGKKIESELRSILKMIEEEIVYEDELNSESPESILEMKSYFLLASLPVSSLPFRKLESLTAWLRRKIPLSTKNYKKQIMSSSRESFFLAIEALSVFKKYMIPLSNPVSTNLTLSFPGLNSQLSPINFSQNNQLVFKEISNISLPQRPIKIESAGSGSCLVVQAIRSFYITSSSLQHTSFNLSVQSQQHSFRCSIRLLQICLTYNGENSKSNLLVLSVNLPTGFVFNNDSIKEMFKGIELRKQMMTDSKLDLVFVIIPGNEICLRLSVHQRFVVSALKSSTVEVYEYFKPDIYASEKYSIEPHFLANNNAMRTMRKLLLQEDMIEKRNYPSVYDDEVHNVLQSSSHLYGNLQSCPICTAHASFEIIRKICALKYTLRIRMENKVGVELKTSYGDNNLTSYNGNITVILTRRCTCKPIKEDRAVEIIVGSDIETVRLEDDSLSVMVDRRGVVLVLDPNVEYAHLNSLFDLLKRKLICGVLG